MTVVRLRKVRAGEYEYVAGRSRISAERTVRRWCVRLYRDGEPGVTVIDDLTFTEARDAAIEAVQFLGLAS